MNIVKLKDVDFIETSILRSPAAQAVWNSREHFLIDVNIQLNNESEIKVVEDFEITSAKQIIPVDIEGFWKKYGKRLGMNIIKNVNRENDYNWARLALNQGI